VEYLLDNLSQLSQALQLDDKLVDSLEKQAGF